MTSETWLPIPGYEGVYSVSDQGRVRSEARVVISSNGVPHPVNERILRARCNRGGYPQVTIFKAGVGSNRTVHTLVAAAFIGPRPEGLETRHLDGNRLNNAPSNLSYGTPIENMQDKRRHGMNYWANKTHCPKGHPYDERNTYVTSTGARQCRACVRARMARTRAGKAPEGEQV